MPRYYTPTYRAIYWRVLLESGKELQGRYTDLKTLRGASRRLESIHRDWRELEVTTTPFPGQEA